MFTYLRSKPFFTHFAYPFLSPLIFLFVPFTLPASVNLTPGKVFIKACTPHKHPPAKYTNSILFSPPCTAKCPNYTRMCPVPSPVSCPFVIYVQSALIISG